MFGKYALTRLVHGTVDTVAVRLEEKHPDLKGRLVAAVELTVPVTYRLPVTAVLPVKVVAPRG